MIASSSNHAGGLCPERQALLEKGRLAAEQLFAGTPEDEDMLPAELVVRGTIGPAPARRRFCSPVRNGIERKLTTILAADVEGYSRLMAADEGAAMTALQDSRAVFARLIDRHRGRIANTAGDALIADFPSVVEAVRCAVEVQTELAARNRSSDPGRAMRFRIGLHLGDVMVDGGDLFGEGVNLAARLQGMAEPGGVLISQAVYDQVRSKLSLGYEYLGERQPKNLAEPVPIYRLLFEGAPPADAAPFSAADTPAAPRSDAPAEAAPAIPTADRRHRLIVLAQRYAIVWAGLVGINLLGGGPFWAIWPGIGLFAALGLQAAPLLVRGWIDVQLVRLCVIVAMLAMINLASWSGHPWFLWPAGAMLVFYLLWPTWRR
jgi:adenylate cyclase